METSLINGNRPLVTVEKDGQEAKMYLETAVRYGKLNFYREDGKPEKREQFLKEPAMSATLSKEKGKEQDIEQGQGVRIK